MAKKKKEEVFVVQHPGYGFYKDTGLMQGKYVENYFDATHMTQEAADRLRSCIHDAMWRHGYCGEVRVLEIVPSRKELLVDSECGEVLEAR